MIEYTFKEKEDIIFSYFQRIVKQQEKETENNYFYGYLKMDIEVEWKSIYLSLYTNYIENSYKVKIPLNEDIEKIYIKKNLDNRYNRDLYIDIVKEEVIKLNNNFFSFFKVNMNSIQFDFPISAKEYNLYEKIEKYHFYIYSLEKDKIDIIIENIYLEKILDDF